MPPDGSFRSLVPDAAALPSDVDPWAGLSFPVLASQRAALEREARRHNAAASDPENSKLSTIPGAPVALSDIDDSGSQKRQQHQSVLRIRGPLQLEWLVRAISGVAQRQASLRTRFEWVNGELLQWIDGFQPVMVPVWSQSPPPDIGLDPELPKAVSAFLNAPLPLNHHPWRIGLFQHSPEDHSLALCLHEAIADSTSVDLFFSELSEYYSMAGERGAGSSGLPELDLQVPDVVEHRRIRWSGPQNSVAREFWRQAFSLLNQGVNASGSLTKQTSALQTEGASRSSSACTQLRWTLPADLGQSWRQNASRLNMPPAILWLATMAEALHSGYGTLDPVMALELSGRDLPGLSELLGPLANPMLIPVQRRLRESFQVWTGKVQSTYMKCIKHADVAFEDLLSGFNRQAEPGTEPARWLIRVPATPRLLPDLPGLEVTAGYQWGALGECDGGIQVRPTGGGVEWELAYADERRGMDATLLPKIQESIHRVVEEVTG